MNAGSMTDSAQAELIELAANGDRRAFERLVEGLLGGLYAYIRTHVSEPENAKDILQEIMLGAWQGIGTFSGCSSFKTWIYGIARRKIADFYRKRCAELSLAEDAYEPEAEEDDYEEVLNAISIEAALKRLRSSDRELLILAFKSQLTYAEIEKLTGIPLGTVKSRMKTIREKLKPLLGGENHV